MSRLQLLRGRPLFLFPCGFQVRAWRVVLDAGFLRVCPIQPHFLSSICLATGSCPARSHRSSFRIFSCHWILSSASCWSSFTIDSDVVLIAGAKVTIVFLVIIIIIISIIIVVVVAAVVFVAAVVVVIPLLLFPLLLLLFLLLLLLLSSSSLSSSFL